MRLTAIVRMLHLPNLLALPGCAATVLLTAALLAGWSTTTLGDSTPAANPLLAQTTTGAVEGFDYGEGIIGFRGIPFAAPPVGELRWKPPQPPVAWQGVREAKAFGSDCMQFPFAPPVTSMSEDCLYLNVYKPASAKEGDHLPVYVWIYGGAFRANTASNPAGEDPGDVRDGIIYVNFNYRVNVFGFMAHPGLTAETTYGASGNYGLMDEIAALEWVRDNIAKFGGDPANVTVSGASAGASSIGYLLISPLNPGLFHRVLMQSTANWHPQRSLAQQEAWSVARFGSDIGTLRAMPAKDLLALTATPDGKRDGSDTLGDGHSGPFSYIDWLPIVDGHVLPVTDRKAWKEGDFKVVDMLIGDVENEGLLFMGFGPPIPMTKAAYTDYMLAQYGSLGEEALVVYPVNNDSEVAFQLGLATGDTLFSLPAREMARRMVKFTPNVYRYHFTKHTVKSPVTLHNAEQAYFFGNMAGNDAYNETDFALSTMMQQAKRRFIRTGNPNGGDLPHWPAYNADDPYMEFGDNGAVPGTGLRNQALDFAVKAVDTKFPVD
jgi:para-nitrobenzyl esterase